jgi:hypothetical protein
LRNAGFELAIVATAVAVVRVAVVARLAAFDSGVSALGTLADRVDDGHVQRGSYLAVDDRLILLFPQAIR